MPRKHVVLYRQLLQALRRMDRAGLPITGCVGMPQASQVLCAAAYLRQAFRAGSSSSDDASNRLTDGFFALRMLPRQLAVLQACEEDTRQALQQWHGLQQQWCSTAPLSISRQLESAEEAAWLLQRLATQQAVQQLLLEEDIEQLQQDSDASIEGARQQLDDLAAAVKAAAPDAFASQPDGPPNSQRLLQLQALSQVLFQQQGRLRCDPFEWVYDGLAPLMLPQVLQTRKGIPLSLAVLAGAVARRLGMQLQLLCADDSQLPGTASGPLLMQQLPPEVAARQAGRTLATAPSPTTWLLQLLPAPGQAWAAQDAVFLDVSRRGQLLDAAGCIQRYPALEAVLQHQQLQQANSSSSSEGGAGVVALWANMARTMVLAHQRRGESDLVAHWLYQVLALDSRAEEWAHAMQ
uniref:Protein SirB1 N-terminal domain-containing protein n=1 Tax=Tetradesmus obliquus TaxID=3088 RepID=A0A383WP88_TETOB|eukprot:jgi/Sobl393_1/13903/SZX79022.1